MKLLIIDSPALCYRAWHKLGGLAYQGQDTGVIYGFLTQLYALAKPFRAGWTLVFCWDSRASKRREIYPDYKRKRREQPMTDEEREKLDAARIQFTKIRRFVLPALGFANNFMETGYESDDLIAQVALCGPGNKNAIISSDHDLYQLLTNKTWIVNPADGHAYTTEHFTNEWGIDPRDWWRVKATAGCATDEVPGIPGIGEKTAAKYYAGALGKGKKLDAILNFPEETWMRNAQLVKLPFEGTPVPRIDQTGFDRDGFLLVCEEYRFNSLEPRVDDWAELFGG